MRSGVKRMSLKKETYEKLRYRIITNDFQSGQQLYEKELMQEYGIGRTPLREIFQELQRNGLIEIIPKLGTRVVSMDLRVLREAVQLRRELEGLAAELATQHIEPEQSARLRQLLDEAAKVKTNSLDALKKLADIDMAFHRIIYEASGNRQLKEMIESLLYKMSMYWFQVGFSAAEFREQFEELEELLRAIERRKKKDAREIMKRHIDHFIKLIKKNIF
jgi:DNA-binding GntR family transcriptional regulator